MDAVAKIWLSFASEIAKQYPFIASKPTENVEVDFAEPLVIEINDKSEDK